MTNENLCPLKHIALSLLLSSAAEEELTLNLAFANGQAFVQYSILGLSVPSLYLRLSLFSILSSYSRYG